MIAAFFGAMLGGVIGIMIVFLIGFAAVDHCDRAVRRGEAKEG